jgi:hypothetical protein
LLACACPDSHFPSGHLHACCWADRTSLRAAHRRKVPRSTRFARAPRRPRISARKRGPDAPISGARKRGPFTCYFKQALGATGAEIAARPRCAEPPDSNAAPSESCSAVQASSVGAAAKGQRLFVASGAQLRSCDEAFGTNLPGCAAPETPFLLLVAGAQRGGSQSCQPAMTSPPTTATATRRGRCAGRRRRPLRHRRLHLPRAQDLKGGRHLHRQQLQRLRAGHEQHPRRRDTCRDGGGLQHRAPRLHRV